MAKAPQGKGTGKTSVSMFALLVIGAMISIVAFPTMLVVGLGMLPTMAAYVVDRTRQKYPTFCVAAMNFAGVFPVLMELWLNDNSVNGATELLTDVFNLLIMYGAAAFGWVLLSFVPPLVAGLIKTMSERKIASLRSDQKQLIKDWGEEVTGHDS